ncbi:hypothetical protein NDA18_000228 [Ustilago nuda]|nr:hypothetical protein NDA18_000228 [Ustilago nuda]
MTWNQPSVYQDAPGLELQNDVLTSVEHAHPEASSPIQLLTGEAADLPQPAQRRSLVSNKSSSDTRQRTRLLSSLMRRKPRSSSKRAPTRSFIRQRAEELARTADSEKAAESRHNRSHTTPSTNDSSSSCSGDSKASSEPARIKLVGEDGKPMRRHGIKDRVLHFTPSWFSVTMGTGVQATLLNLLPWASIHSGLRWPALCFLLGDIMIFILFLCAFFARYLMYPEVLFLTIKHPQKSMFLGTLPMALITIISGIAQLGTELGLGIGFALGASGLWWAVTVLSLMTAIGVPFSMMTYQEHYFEGTTAALLLPIVPPITAAATGSVIAEMLMERYPTYAFTIMVVSYLVLGIGLPLALLILVLYFQRLLLFKSPPRDVIISVFLPLGPCGQGGEACLHLGRVALHLFQRSPASGVAQLYSVGQALYGAGLISAMLLFGLGIWWLAIGLLTIIRELKRGKLQFNMGWWGLTFPFASLAICTARLAIELDSLTLKVTYTVFAIANLLLWIGVAIPTVRGGWNGRLFNAPCLADLPLKP